MKRILLLSPLLLLAACTATEQSAESGAARSVPTEVRTDADRRAIYDEGRGTNNSPVPDATPNTQRLGDQASDINRRERVGTINTNNPNTTSTQTHVERQSETPPAIAVPQ